MSTMTDAEMDALMAEIEATTPTTATPAAVEPKPETPPWEEPAKPEPVAEAPKPAAAPSVAAPMEVAEAPAASVEPPKPAPRVVAASDGTALNTFIDGEQVKRDISINTADLDTAMIEHPALELHYSMQTAHARRQFERLKSAVEILEAKIDSEVREKWVGEKKPTEASIKAAVLADKRYSAAQSKLIDAQHIWKLCEATENAFHSRKDLLLEVARDRRKEKEGQMRILEGQEMRESVVKMLRESKVA